MLNAAHKTSIYDDVLSLSELLAAGNKDVEDALPTTALERLKPGQYVSWTPQPGSQNMFLMCPVFETLYEGTRGPGKTDALLMDFVQHTGQGFGEAWRGILFRQTYKQLQDVIAKSKKVFNQMPRNCRPTYNKVDSTWTFPEGEQLLLRHMKDPDDYWNYHGHEYPWIAWEELTSWANSQCYTIMMSCCRSSHPGMPRKYRSTTNPYGVGHNWVKKRFRLPSMRGVVIREPGEPERIAIHGRLEENIILLASEPDYIDKIRAAARNPSELAAWLHGSWDILAGGMFDDVWDAQVHVVDAFNIPRSWRLDRSFDWGSSKPFSVGWWAQSNGESPVDRYGKPLFHSVKGDLYRIREWYGCVPKRDNEGLKMLAKDIAVGIKHKEKQWGLGGLVKPGPADSSIWDDQNGNCIATDMRLEGVNWEPADKGPGSRKQGWEQMRKRFEGAKNPEYGLREDPGVFCFRGECPDFENLVPTLPRDDKDLDDVDTDAEDHIGDEARYRIRRKNRSIRTGTY